MKSAIDVVILGAGPYGLSIAAHLDRYKVPYRIFGIPMNSWKNMMPRGMTLKSEGFASRVYDPDGSFTLENYCRDTGQPYQDVGLPVPLDTFIAYGIAFQKRLVPNLEETNITSIKRSSGGFEVTIEGGEIINARRVVLAAGIGYFGYLPPPLSDLPGELVSHSSKHSDLSGFRGRKVAVIGGGSSAVDVAALVNEAGAQVELVARSPVIGFHQPSTEPRPLLQRIVKPRTTIGLGWRSRLCVDAPWLFHAMPQQFRHEVVRRHLGPVSSWAVKDKVVGRFPMHVSTTVNKAEVQGSQVRLTLGKNGGTSQIVVDHVIAGTGYRVSLQRLKFLDGDLLRQINAAEDTPVLSQSFEASVPGLFFVGTASANCFGPLTRFACGAEFTAKRISKHLAATKSAA